MVKKSKFGIVALSLGLILMLISLFIYYFVSNGFIRDVHSEIFGFGITIFLIGLIFRIFKIKIG